MTLQEEIERKQREILELKKKIEEEQPLTLTVGNITTEKFVAIHSKPREDYRRFLADSGVQYYYDMYSNSDRISLKNWEEWFHWVTNAPNVKLEITKTQLELIKYYLYEPDVIISLHATEFRLKVKSTVDFQQMMGDLYPLTRYNGSTSKYHYPLNEGARLYRKLQNTVKWEEGAKELCIKQLEERSRLSDIAAMEYSKEGDITLSNGEALKPFQTVGVHYIQTIGYRGIIADEMGLGKTAQAIASAISANAKKIAVIVPATVRENWRREILRYSGDDAMMMMGTTPETWDISAILTSNKRWFIFNYDQFSRPVKERKDGHEIFKFPWIGIINSMMFDMVILDEAHRCKNLDAARTKAILQLSVPKIIGLTGTPILNRPGELWPILHLLSPNAFNSYDGFLNRYTDGKNGVRNQGELKELIAPYFIRRRKKDVQKDLPPIIRETHYVELSGEDLANYAKLMNQIRIDLRSGDETGVINNILEKILRIKQFLSIRKAQAVADFVIDTYDQAEEDEQYKKIIIFSQFIDCVDEITNLLGGEALQIVGSRHSPMERQTIVDRFQSEDQYKFLVCSTTAANEGLNITAAGHVVFNDFMWTPAAHSQAEGRAYGRLNDPHTIESHYFAVPNTLDDWLQGILLEKMTVIEEVVEGMGDARTAESSILKSLMAAIRSGAL